MCKIDNVVNTKIGQLFFTTYGRTALLLALKSIPVYGKEVIIPAFTCPIGVINPVIAAGGIPVFADINLKNLNFDIQDLEQKITDSTAAIISHHYFGMVNPEIEVNQSIAKEHRVIHVEDCTHSLGALFNGQDIGMVGDFGVYSFSKCMISPGGGALRCNKDTLLNKIQNLYTQTRAGYIATFLADVEFFNFFYTLWIIKKLGSPAGMRLPKNFLLYFIPNCWYLPTKLLKLFSNKPYYNGSFYNIDETIQSKDFPEFDARMTRFQKSIIRGRVELFQEMCSKRRSIADRFNAITPHFFPETKNRRFVYTNYVFWTNAKNEVLSAAKDANVLFDKTWPDEGRYRKAQNTSNIEKIKNKMLLLSISPYWSEKDIHVIEQFIHKNSGLFSKPLDF